MPNLWLQLFRKGNWNKHVAAVHEGKKTNKMWHCTTDFTRLKRLATFILDNFDPMVCDFYAVEFFCFGSDLSLNSLKDATLQKIYFRPRNTYRIFLCLWWIQNCLKKSDHLYCNSETSCDMPNGVIQCILSQIDHWNCLEC